MKKQTMKRKAAKRNVCIFGLAGCLTFGLLSGCGKKEIDNTLRMMIPLEVRADESEHFMNVLKEQFPDITFEVEYMGGGDPAIYQAERLRNDDAPDLVWYSGKMQDDLAKDKLVKLSGESYIGNFDSSILALYDVDGEIYQVPGPVAAQCIIVNKTLLAELGLEVPTDFDELVHAAKEIHEAYPEMTPLSLGMSNYFATMRFLLAMNGCGFLTTSEGQAWEEAYLNGETSIEEGFSEGLDMMGRLIDAGAFYTDANVKLWDMSANEMLVRNIAMSTNMMVPRQSTWLFQWDPNVETDYKDEFVFLPFFGAEKGEEGLGILSHSAWGINKDLEEKDDKQKLANAGRVLKFLSTEAGQEALMPNDTYVPALREIKNDTRPEYLKTLWDSTANAKKFFTVSDEYDDVRDACVEVIWDAMKEGSSKGMKERFIETADQLHKASLEGTERSTTVGSVEEKILAVQAMELYRQAMCEASGADLALTSTNGWRNGERNSRGLNAVNFYPGELSSSVLDAGIGGPDLTILTTMLTGKEIRKLLDDGKQNGAFVYSAAGMDVTYDETGKVKSISQNGVELENDREYTVAFIDTDFDDAFAKEHPMTDTQVRMTDAAADYFRAHSPVGAARVKE